MKGYTAAVRHSARMHLVQSHPPVLLQSSTLLWEQVAAETMDAALKLHHSVVRRVAAHNNGYESATEVRTTPER